MTQPGSTRVLVVDNHAQVYEDLRELLQPSGFAVHVVTSDNLPLGEQAILDARIVRPHVIVLDLRLHNDYQTEYSGLDILHHLLPAHCILYSAYLTLDAVTDVTNLLFAWVKKSDAPNMLRTSIQRGAKQKSAAASTTQLIWPAAFDRTAIVASIADPNLPAPPGSILDDVVVQLYPQRHRVHLQPLKVSGDAPSDVARIRSAVFLARADELSPTVLKFARSTQLEQEERNYAEYIFQRLPGLMSTQLVNHVRFWDVGAAVYTFMGTLDQALPTFANFYRHQADATAITRVLQFFFSKLWRPYYNTPRPLGANTLFDAYDQVFKLRQHEHNLNQLYYQLLSTLELPISQHNPVAWLFRHIGHSHVETASAAITHGDLHGDNIFVDDDRVWVIDFERTGYGHILRDFVELEVDILTRLLPYDQVDDDNFFNLLSTLYNGRFELLTYVASDQSPPNLELQKALIVVVGLRKLAREVALFEAHEYYWGILFDALFVASIGKAHPQQQKRAMLISTIVGDMLRR